MNAALTVWFIVNSPYSSREMGERTSGNSYFGQGGMSAIDQVSPARGSSLRIHDMMIWQFEGWRPGMKSLASEPISENHHSLQQKQHYP